jgi:prephenate dehydrogenase
MKTLIYGAGPIGRWLTLGLHNAGKWDYTCRRAHKRKESC